MRRRVARWVRRLADITRWPATLVLFAAGGLAVALAFATVSLFQEAMANLSFIRTHGLMAVREGALVQLSRLFLSGGLALLCYLGFKFCEVDLSIRYRAWATRRDSDQDADGHGVARTLRKLSSE